MSRRSIVTPSSVRRSLVAIGLGLPVVLALAGPAAADADRIEKRLWLSVGAGSVQVDKFREMREDCALAPAPVVTVLQNPAFGKLSVSTAQAVGATDKNGPYGACDGKKFNWTIVKIPLPAKGEGTDKAVVQAQESSGEATIYDIEIVYAKKLPVGKKSGLLEDR